jgi:hypothetical protein
MKKESLDKALTAIILVLRDLDIDNIDRVELMTNLYHLLSDKEEYERSIEILQSNQEQKILRKGR